MVGRNPESWDSGGIVGKLLDFFLESEMGDQRIGSGFNGEGCVAKWIEIEMWGLARILKK